MKKILFVLLCLLFIGCSNNKNVDDTGARFLISLIDNTCNGNILYGQQKEFTIIIILYF